MNDARYYGITLEPDRDGAAGTYQLKFSTMPGMSTSITELRMGDLDALAGILSERNDVSGAGWKITTAPRKPAPGEPCAHCSGVGSGCQCDIEYV